MYTTGDVDRLYVSRKEEGRGLASIEDNIDASIQRLEDYKEKRGPRLITTTRNNTEDTRFNRTEITRKLKWEEKQLYGCFKRLTSDKKKKKWIKKMDVGKKRET